MNGSQTVHERFMNIGYTNGALSHRLSSNDTPHPDDPLKNAARKKILHYRQLYADKTDPIIFLPVTVNTSGRIYDDFVRLLFLDTHRETSVWTGELPEESVQ